MEEMAMKRYELNGIWKMDRNGFSCTGNIRFTTTRRSMEEIRRSA
jgi:hypothetical protein